jgi:ethanolamine kinase
MVAFYQKRLGLQNSGEDVILLRVDGVGTEKFINRTDEVVTILFLNRAGLCPPLHAQLKNGLCYGFSPGRRMKVHETNSNNFLMRRIAGVMARLHSLEMPSHFKDREPFLWLKISELLKSVPPSFSNPIMQEAFLASIVSIEKLQGEIEATRNLILRDCKSPVVFCHNDVHSANMIYNEETDTIRLIDYEYAGPNYFAFDIANHFCEFAGVENVDYQKYPSEMVQKMWIRMYLEEFQMLKGEDKASPIEDTAVNSLYIEVNKLVLGCHLLWVVWALFQAGNSTIEFDFIEYASMRYAEYVKRKTLLPQL